MYLLDLFIYANFMGLVKQLKPFWFMILIHGPIKEESAVLLLRIL